MTGVTRLDPAGYRRTPWKNGGGVTVDIADAYEPGAEPGSWSGMRWRLGRTEIVTEGPFSDLSGYDRILTVIGGHGLTLEIAGGAVLDVREPFRPVRFRGEDRIVSRLETGPVAVLNLIANRHHEIDVAILKGPAEQRAEADIVIVYAIEDSAIGVGAERFPLAADAALRIDGGADMIVVERGRAALASISSRSAP
jgi:environmental stress-induced protein Ves